MVIEYQLSILGHYRLVKIRFKYSFMEIIYFLQKTDFCKFHWENIFVKKGNKWEK